MKRAIAWMVALAVSLLACTDELPAVTTLHVDPNPMTTLDKMWSPQPHRDRPRAICTTANATKAWVMLAGTDDDPGQSIAVVDLAARKVLKKVALAGTPYGCALHPSQKFLVVTQRYSDHAVVLDASTDAEVARIPVPFYTEEVLFNANGSRLWLANRWKDSVLWWDVRVQDGEFAVTATNYGDRAADQSMGIPVSDNPGRLALSGDGKRLFVGSVAGCTIAVVDAQTGTLVDVDQDPATTTAGAPPGISHIDLHSPVGGMVTRGNFLYVADMGRGLGAQPDQGIDIDADGKAGDATANQAFQDQQNEIGVVDTTALHEVFRYTSDTIVARDFRDVDPAHPEKGPMLPLADQWSPSVVNFMPPATTWTVAGALPEAMLVQGDDLFVAFAGSNEVQRFAVAADGSLSTTQAAGQLWRTGYNPKALAIGPGGQVVTVDRLGESLTFIDPKQAPGAAEKQLVIGDVAGGPFPATDAELGEGVNEMTAVFTIDGDQTCVQCHRDNGAMARPFVMPLQSSRAWSLRNVMAQRGLYDTRPWFFESAMNEDNFFPVLNEFVRRENFCCEQLDMLVWGKYPKVDVCQADPNTAGCSHVLHCEEDPPPECAQRAYGSKTFLKRSDFMKDAAKHLFGRDTTFGDAVYKADSKGQKKALPLDFDGVTRVLGLFMMRTPRLLPNPNRYLNLPSAKRGAALYKDPGVGCNNCHPLPNTTTATGPVPFSPFGMPVHFPPVISPERRPDGSDAMLVNPTFIATFPLVVQDAAGLHLGSTPLRGIWDRPQTRFYHDGRARSLREALATPGHTVLLPGETGYNERGGSFDTHGGTSQLSKYQMQDLIHYLLTL